MDIFEVIKKRRSIRSYSSREIEEEKLREILEAARLAPSASNRQEWRFIIVKDKEKRKALCVAAKNQVFVEEAPLVIVCCAQTDNYRMSCGQLSYPIDVAIAIEHISLTAVSLGLGSCWVGAFYEDEVKKILKIPSEVRVVELLTVGYPKEENYFPHNRLALKEIVFKEKWGIPYYL